MTTSKSRDKNEDIELEDQSQLDSYSDEQTVLTKPKEVRIAKEQYSVFELLRKIQKKQLILAPEFQRADVWKNPQRAELLESILLGIPIPLIYLFEDKNGVRQVVDGRQRITALQKFYDGKFKFTKLKVLTKLNGKSFGELDPFYQSKIEDYQINTYVIQPPTPESIKFNIFDRVNRGGVQLNKQEMRHALYQGKATDLLKVLSENEAFKKVTGNTVSPKRMRDKYLIIRLIGFYLYQKNRLSIIKNGETTKYQYRSDIDDFLALVMDFINKQDSKDLNEELEGLFNDAMINIHNILGDEVFRFETKTKTKRPINIGLFEMLSYCLMEGTPDKCHLIEFKGEVNSIKKTIDSDKLFATGADSKTVVDIRFAYAESLIEKYIKVNHAKKS
ncbi:MULTISPECIES: DUF262 domain-containing protein [unclassified Pseudoalteromonas]|uniref:DUF262 domain-containing protein n=1 Tax=Pseudoalteromonas sp. RB2-MNA-CIBAN-0110 TaxID=3140439 RepID=UPI00042576E9|nr:DUF262 domain-containing protein [Pseudoalteromonas sp. TB13]